MKKEGRLHIRLESSLLKEARAVAATRGVSLSYLVSEQLRAIVAAHKVERGLQAAAAEPEQV